MRLKTLRLPAIIALCTALAACGGAGASSSAPARTASSSTAPGTSPSSVNPFQAESYDNKNPGRDCGTNGQLKNPYIKTVGPPAMVRLPNRQPFGALLLRHSTICQTAWGEVVFTGAEPAGFTKVTIVVQRVGGRNPKTLPPFYTNDYVSPVFSSMLGNNMGDGCVQATAWVTIGGSDGPKATTHCGAG